MTKEQDEKSDDKRALERELPEPEEGANPWPHAVWLFFGIMIGWGATYLALETGSGNVSGGDLRTLENPQVAKSEDEIKIDGSIVYKNACTACHQQTGLGIPGAFPPLAESDWLKDPHIPAKIVLKGLQGEVEVKGVKFDGVMPPLEQQLKDNEIAAVVNYIRNEWGNKYEGEITSKEVAELREQFKSKADPWKASDLK